MKPHQYQPIVVLVVEDDALVLMLALDALRDEGLEAIGAANADHAIRILECRDDVRVIFTDINMPGTMDGLKLAHAVRGRWAPVQIIVTSALGAPGRGSLPEGGRFVPKPYETADVMQAIREMTA
jgi:CheY-like chemotaxis protein